MVGETILSTTTESGDPVVQNRQDPPHFLPTLIDLGDENPIEKASSLAELGTLVLSTSDTLKKSKLSHLAYSRWRQDLLPVGASGPPPRPARPPKPELVWFSYSYDFQTFVICCGDLLGSLETSWGKLIDGFFFGGCGMQFFVFNFDYCCNHV